MNYPEFSANWFSCRLLVILPHLSHVILYTQTKQYCIHLILHSIPLHLIQSNTDSSLKIHLDQISIHIINPLDSIIPISIIFPTNCHCITSPKYLVILLYFFRNRKWGENNIYAISHESIKKFQISVQNNMTRPIHDGV